MIGPWTIASCWALCGSAFLLHETWPVRGQGISLFNREVSDKYAIPAVALAGAVGAFLVPPLLVPSALVTVTEMVSISILPTSFLAKGVHWGRTNKKNKYRGWKNGVWIEEFPKEEESYFLYSGRFFRIDKQLPPQLIS